MNETENHQRNMNTYTTR